MINKILIIIKAICKINWLLFFRLYDHKSENALWIIKSYGFSSFLNNNLLNDLALVSSFLKRRKNFKLFFGTRVGKISSSKIFYNISRQVNQFNFIDNSATLCHVVSVLESQGNLCFPSSAECACWENKYTMYNKLTEVELVFPKTQILDRNKIFNFEDIQYPIILKNGYLSGGEGVFSIENRSELQEVLGNNIFNRCEKIILQERVAMTKDIRVIVIGSEVVLHYWRINNQDIWKKTSTSSGSTVDFIYLPTGLGDLLVKATKKLGWAAAAYDVTYANDNIGTKPLILEVSPAFMPNPIPRISFKDKNYSNYKTSFYSFLFYINDYVDLVFNLKQKYVDSIYLEYDKNLFDG